MKNHFTKQRTTRRLCASHELGLVLNLGLEAMKERITRIVNGLPE